MKISESLKRFRESFGLSQKAVAEILGITQPAYSFYEKEGGYIPSAEMLIKLADQYKVSVDYLLGRTDKPNPYDTPPMFKQMVKDGPVITSMLKEKPVESLQSRLARIESALTANGIQI